MTTWESKLIYLFFHQSLSQKIIKVIFCSTPLMIWISYLVLPPFTLKYKDSKNGNMPTGVRAGYGQIKIEDTVYFMKRIEFSPKYSFKDNDSRHYSYYKSILNEGKIMKMLDHPNIVKLFAVFKETDKSIKSFGLVTEFCQEDLSDFVINGKMAIESLLEFIYSMLEALEYLHQNNIYHLDIKLDNIVVCNGIFKLIDFNMSKMHKEVTKFVGTEYYWDPKVKIAFYSRKLPIPEMDSEKLDMFALGKSIALATDIVSNKDGLFESGFQKDLIESCFKESHIQHLKEGFKKESIYHHYYIAMLAAARMMHCNPVKRPTATEMLRLVGPTE
eukprot:NODE_528_length_6433_cov_0.887907.p4 type:complete len:330 gc:universal NODE_528_length_6433_cov_0.887907:4551-3562(-)